MTKSRQTLVEQLVQTHMHVRQLFMKSLNSTLGEQASQGCFTVLKVLAKHGPLSQHAIAQELFHSDAAVSRQIKLLLKQNYITTSSDPSNRRRTMIKLTAQGRAVLKKFQTDMYQQIAELLNPLSDTKLKQLIKATQELQAIIIKQQSS